MLIAWGGIGSQVWGCCLDRLHAMRDRAGVVCLCFVLPFSAGEVPWLLNGGM